MKYFSKLKLSSNQVNIITDKMPQNFSYIGLLSVSFPNADLFMLKEIQLQFAGVIINSFSA